MSVGFLMKQFRRNPFWRDRNMSNGWNQLHCPFFASSCLFVLEDYFQKAGFVKHRLDKIDGVIFEKNNIYVEISYEAETFPNYSPTLLIGLNSNAVPFWFIIPTTDNASKYTSWKFETEKELLSVLERIKISILETFGKPLWNDVTDLERYLNRFNSEFIP
jgi:hypothetical protein